MSLNQVTLLGRLGQDPELKYTQTGSAVCNISLATTKSYKDKNGQKQESTSWHRVIVWGKLAELCNQYLKKGSQCLVIGEINYRSWEDNQGTKKYTTEINATEVQFLGGTSNSPSEKQSGDSPGSPDYEPAINHTFASDEIPF